MGLIRTPIHGILGLTALLLESELTPDQTESLESVKECADLLLHIINSVLDLAKIEAGRLEVEKVPFNIRKMVSSTFRMLQARAQQRGLKLLWEVDKCVPQTLVGDVGKLQQCLLNLGLSGLFMPILCLFIFNLRTICYASVICIFTNLLSTKDNVAMLSTGQIFKETKQTFHRHVEICKY